MASSIPGAMDYLFTNVGALPECAAPVEVADGWPKTAEKQVAIGITPEDNEADITGDWAELTREEYENVELPCLVSVHKLGVDQKAARDEAFAIFDAIVAKIRSDRRFGGAIKTGMPARVIRFRVYHTATATEAGEGRACEIRFVIGWQHRG